MPENFSSVFIFVGYGVCEPWSDSEFVSSRPWRPKPIFEEHREASREYLKRRMERLPNLCFCRVSFNVCFPIFLQKMYRNGRPQAYIGTCVWEKTLAGNPQSQRGRHPAGVADVYVDSRSRVWLLDINPFSTVTDSLLFDWTEDTLAAPLTAPPTEQEDEEELPPDVFLRLHFQPSEEPPVTQARETSTTTPSNGVRAHGGSQEGQAIELSNMGFSLGTRDTLDFDFRIIPSELHLVPDPMARYRGPADLDMGTLVGSTSGNEDVEQLVERCRLEAESSE